MDVTQEAREFGARVKQAREAMDMPRRELADRARITTRMVKWIEHGLIMVGTPPAKAVAEVLGLGEEPTPSARTAEMHLSELISLLAAKLREVGDVRVGYATGAEWARGIGGARLDSTCKIDPLLPECDIELRGTRDEEDPGLELTPPGMRLDGREPCIILY